MFPRIVPIVQMMLFSPMFICVFFKLTCEAYISRGVFIMARHTAGLIRKNPALFTAEFLYMFIYSFCCFRLIIFSTFPLIVGIEWYLIIIFNFYSNFGVYHMVIIIRLLNNIVMTIFFYIQKFFVSCVPVDIIKFISNNLFFCIKLINRHGVSQSCHH